MEVRIEKTDNFYNTAVSWWDKHDFPNVHKSFLPEEVFVANNNGVDIYCCFFYHTNSALAWVAYPISNKDVPKNEREGGLKFLFDEMEKYAKEQGYYLLFTTSPIKNVIDVLKETGYTEGDLSVNQYFKPIS